MWVVIALACIVLLVILLLCIPIDLKFSAVINENPHFNIRLLWFFGLVDHELRKTGGKTKTIKAKTKQKQKHKLKIASIFRIVRTRGLFGQLWLLVKGITRSFSIKKLLVHVKLGFENPADTALLYSLAGPINYLFNKPSCDIKLMPIFEGDLYFEAYLSGIARIIPILGVLAALQFVFSLPVLRIVKTMAVMRWKRV